MPAEPPKTGLRRRAQSLLPLKLDELQEELEARLDDPLAVLEQIQHALSKGQDVSALFDALHGAAVRYDKVSELAFAYEHIAGDKRIRLMTPEQQALVYLQAARFFSDTFGDPDGAIGYAERALAAAPRNTEAFNRLEALLTEAEEPIRLARFYVDAASHEKDRSQELLFLSRAAELVESEPAAVELAIEIYEKILNIEPDAAATRAALEQRLLASGRHREAALLLERALSRDPPPDEAEARLIRERLVTRYMNELGEPQNAMPHVEALLALEPGHELARSAAEALLEVGRVSVRATAALADAYERLGQLDTAAAMLAQELKAVRGPRRVEVQRRLSILKQDVLNDPAGALELMAPVVAGDPGDDALRRRFVKLSASLDQPLLAARLLQRALQTNKDPAVRARVGAEIGSIFMESGDVKSAQLAFRQVLETGHDDGAVLQAAERLSELHAEAGELKALSATLELVVRLEPERERRQAAARRLARLCESEVDDPNRAIVAYRALIGSPWTDEALRKLETLYESLDAYEGLAEILALRAERVRDPTEARELAFRAAELRTQRSRDRAGALDAWRSLSKKYGPARDVHARLVPLLEQAQQWQELAAVLEQEIALAPVEERPGLLSRLAHVRASRLGDPASALGVFRQALAVDPQDRSSRSAVEKLLSSGSLKLQAAEILEPIYRKERSAAGLLRVLETRAEAAPDHEARLRALTEAAEVADQQLTDPAKALELAARGLELCVSADAKRIAEWTQRVERHGKSVGDPTLYAEALARALGDRVVDSDELLTLCRSAAEALVAAGEIPRALEAFRRALAYAPASQELLGRIDEILAKQGSPEERLLLYRSALEREPEVARRRELYRAIATLERRELKDPARALTTWRAAVADDPHDLQAHQALIEACEEVGDKQGVYAELLWLVEQVDGERKALTLLRLAEVALECGDPQTALTHYQNLLHVADLADDVLEQIADLAEKQGDAQISRAVLERRVALATEPEERAKLLERLGNLYAWHMSDGALAVEVWLEAARLSESSASDATRAARLYERVLSESPEHGEAAERLFDLYARAGAWEYIPEVFEVLLRSPGQREPVSLVLELRELATTAVAAQVYARLVDAVLDRPLEFGRVQALLLSKAQVLAQYPECQAQVPVIYRALLEAEGPESSSITEAFEAFLSAQEPSPERDAERRWLLRYRAEHSAEPVSALMTWAHIEEQEFGNLALAAELYERVLAAEPDRLDALSELSRLRASQGDAAGALATLSALRERSDETARVSVELTMANLLLEQLGRPADALDLVEPLLGASVPESEALRIVHGALGFDQTRARAAELLDRASQSSEDLNARAAVLEVLLSIDVDKSSELAQTRRHWYRQLLEIPSVDERTALSMAVRAAGEFSSDDEIWEAAERLARRLDEPAPVADAYAAAVNAAGSPEAVEALGRRMVEFNEEWFEDQDRVVALLERVLELSPGATWAFDRLKLAFNAAGRWPELFALYDRALAKNPEEAYRVELLREAAMAAKDFAGDAPRALGYLEELDRLRPGDPRIDAALERLYERHGHWRPLIALLQRRLGSASASAAHELSARIASLWIDLGEAEPPFEIAERLLAEDADDPTAVSLLERLILLPEARQSASAAPDEPRAASVRDRAAVHLRGHYERAGRIGDAVRMMEIEIETLSDPAERAARLLALVDIRGNKLGDWPGAFKAAAALVELEPANGEHRTRLKELSERTAAEAERADLLIRLAEAENEAVAVELFSEAAQIREQSLADEAGAIDLYSRVLSSEIRPEFALDAARRLDVLLARAGRAAERCAVLERRALLEPEADAKRAVLGEAARVADVELVDPNRAIANWRARLELDRADGEALDGLIDVLTRAERWDELPNSLLYRSSLSQTPEAARADRVRVARLHEGQRGDRAAAIDTWLAIRRDFGRDPESLAALIALLEAEERWAGLADLLSEEAQVETALEQRADLYRKLGEIHQHKTLDPLAALRAYVAASAWDRAVEVAAASTNLELGLEVCKTLLELSIQAWTDVNADPGTGAARATDWAIEELSERLLELGHHAEVVELLLRGASLPLPKRRRRELRREAACLCSDRLDAPERAMTLFRGLFSEDPGDDVAAGSVTRLALLLEEHGLDEEIVALWEEQARARQRAGDVAASAALWARAADLAEQRLGDLDRALADYSEGAGLGGEACLEALARIHEQRGEHRRAAEVLEWLCAQSPRDALAERALRLAEAYLASGDKARARARLEQAASTAIDTAAVRRRLAELYREGRQWQPLAELLAAEASRAGDVKARLGLLREAAAIHLEQRNDPVSASALLEQALELSPDDPLLCLALSDALRLAGRYSEASEYLRQQVSRYGTRRPKDRALVHWALSRVALASGQRAEALAELDVATKIDPAHPGILQALARLSFEEGQIERAERMYRALLLVHASSNEADAPSRAEALLDLSEIAAKKQDRARAAEFIESAFEAALSSEREAESLERSLRTRDRPELLARALEERLKGDLEPREAARVLADLAMLHGQTDAGIQAASTKLRERAVRIHRDLEKNNEADDVAWSALGRIYDFLGDREAEQRVIERRVALFDAARDVATDAAPFYRLAEMRLANEEQSSEGLALLERALAIDPDLERAGQLLEGVVRRNPGDERALGLLESIARRAAQPRLLLEALALRVALPVGPAPEALREGTALALELHELARAEDMLRAALGNQAAPLARDDAAWAKLELARLCEAKGSQVEALDLREQGALLLSGEAARPALLHVARAAVAQDDPARAIRVYEHLLAREPADREVWEPLLDLYRKQQDGERLVALIDQTVPLVDSAADRARLRLEQATLLLEQSGKEEAAAQALRDILAENPTESQAAVLLSKLLEARGQHEELTELLQTQLDAAKDRQDLPAIVALSLRIGGLLEQQSRNTEALDVYRAVLDWDSASRPALSAALRLSEASSDPFLIADALEALLAVEKGPPADELAKRLLELRSAQGDEEGAERALRLGVGANPSSGELRDALVTRLSERGDWASVASILQVAFETDPNDAELLVRLIAAHRSAGQHDEALACLERRMAQDPGDPKLFHERAVMLGELGRDDEALSDLESAYALGGDFAEALVEALERAIARAEPPADRELTLRLAQVLEDTGDIEGARARLGELVKESPREVPALWRLSELEMKAGQYSAAGNTYRRLLAIEEGPKLVEVALKLSEACRAADRFADARAGLERALKVDPANAQVRAELRALYASIGANRELCGLLLEEAQAETDVVGRHQRLLEAGELLLSTEGSNDEAIRVLEQAHALSPEDIHGVVLLARGYAHAKRSEDALRILNDTVLSYRGRRVKQLGAVYQEISAIQLMEGFLSDALAALSKAFDMDMRNGRLAMQLGQLALDIDEEEAAVRAFRSVTMMKPSEGDATEGATAEAKADAHYQLAVIARKQADLRKARVLLSKALSENPGHAAARALLEELDWADRPA